MTKDIRKEQVSLLRVEKKIVALAAALASATAAAKAADGKLQAEGASTALSEAQAALMNVAEIAGRAHDALNASAIDAGMRTLQATGGVPKRSVSSTVASIFGIG